MPNLFQKGDTLILPPNGTQTLTEAISEALEALSMTRCPYYQREEKCDRGCYVEPLCTAGQPTGGWVEAAIRALEAALPADLDDSLPSRDSDQPKEP